MFTVLFALATLFAQTPATALKVTPAVIAQIDLGKLQGQVRQLAWSPDGNTLYLQTYDMNKDGSLKAKYHYTMPVATGVPAKAEDTPAWAADYLNWSTGKAAPGDAGFSIVLDQGTKTLSATSTPMGGDYARGGNPDAGAGTSVDNVASATMGQQKVAVITLRLLGEVVGEFVNQVFVPGLTFGWAPTGTGLIAFAEANGGKLVIMDHSGAKQKVDGTKNVAVPAWSADGARLAYLQGQGKNKYALVIATVGK